jgi:hypothetical protein
MDPSQPVNHFFAGLPIVVGPWQTNFSILGRQAKAATGHGTGRRFQLQDAGPVCTACFFAANIDNMKISYRFCPL